MSPEKDESSELYEMFCTANCKYEKINPVFPV